MHVITQRKIIAAKAQHPECRRALHGWLKLVQSNALFRFADLKGVFNSVDKVGSLFVFNINGHELKLIASIHFNRQKLYIRHILTHKEYDTLRQRQ